METVDYLVIGAGMSGLGFASWLRELAPAARVLVLEREAETGGYCRTVERDGFVWDYSGHFFHFKHADIEARLRARMPGEDVRTVVKLSSIRYAGRDIEFPFQKNIHQLPHEEFLECLVDVFFAASGRPTDAAPPRSFGEMLYQRLGKGITDKFLRPYNEKLYATDLDRLDVDAMGRFFPHADLADIIGNMRPGGPGGALPASPVGGRSPGKSAGYNATFTYPAGGAIRYVRALERDLPPDAVRCSEPVTHLDTAARIATTPRGQVQYRHLVSSAPLPALARMCDEPHDASVFTSNKVLVFNLGFDRKGPTGVHWMYFPDKGTVFYRVGWYDNIIQTSAVDPPRMSLYVEIGARTDETFDVAALLARVLADLAREGIVTDHQLVASHHVVLDPAYVHITQASLAETARLRGALAAKGVHAVGRYGGWTYCSIEDNLLETRALARQLVAER